MRISWDEATDLIAAEIRRVHQKYGPYAILCQADGHGTYKVVNGAHGCNTNLLTLMGGYTMQVRNPDSWEGWWWGAKHTWGMEPVGMSMPQTNAPLDVFQNSEMVLFWGCDFETTNWGFGDQSLSRWCYFMTELGIKSIYICPDVNYAAGIHADKWIPIKPNTDPALQLAVAYVWMSEGLYDQEYVSTHTFGYEKFEEYVLGKEDGVPKTPRWASEKTGIPPWTIKALAREWHARATSIAHWCGDAMFRGPYSTEPARLEVLLLAMQGIGKEGVQQLNVQSYFGIDGAICPRPSRYPDLFEAEHGHNYLRDPLPKQNIIKTLIPEAILNPPVSWYSVGICMMPVEDQFIKYHYPIEGCSEVHMIWSDTPCWDTCWNNGNKILEAYQSDKIECIVVQHPWMENECMFADIILPITSKLEEEDIGVDILGGEFYSIYYEGKCIEPLGEAMSDYEAVGEVAKKLGLYDEYTGGRTVQEWIRYGFETSGCQDLISWEDFKEKGYFVIPTDPEWAEYAPPLRWFYYYPEEYPLKTPSGKIEFFSQNLAHYFPDDEERPPVPRWIPSGVSHQETLETERAKKYPLLMLSNHPRWRMHAQHDDVTWTREIPTCKVRGPDGYMYEPVWLHPSEAEKRGIKDGDVIKIFNERGAVLGGALVTERVMPGVVYQDHGARCDHIVPGELDRGGANNLICPSSTVSKNATGMATSGFLVNIDKVDVFELMKQYPEEFNREYDPASGPLFTAWIEGGAE